MINKSGAALREVVIHHIGRKSENEDIVLGIEAVDVSDDELRGSLLTYFTQSFGEPDFYSFSFHEGDFVLNPMFNYIGNIFDDPTLVHEMSIKIARLLYEKSGNPLIKQGDLCIAYIEGLLVDDEMVDAVCILKSENKDSFIQIAREARHVGMSLQEGIHLKNIDKVCLVLNADRELGFKILNIDHSNKNIEARYWRDDFLFLEKSNNEYQQTTEVIKLTADFVKNRLPADAPISKSDQASFLKKSEKYFKNNEAFDSETYTEAIFDQPKLKEAFLNFADQSSKYKYPEEAFQISEFAVKKQSRVFKSIIKLDKNFHIYVHGDSSKIVKGALDNGQKYYMIYYDEET